MSRVIVHAGPGKTGTSAIQSWLNENAEALRGEGVFYPRHASDSNQVSSGNLLEIYDRDAAGGLVLNEESVAALLATFSESGCHTLVLSSEFFFFKMVELSKALPNAELVAYLRDPIELEESGYNQEVKRHGQKRTFQPSGKFRWGMLGYLTRVLRNAHQPKVMLRPYAPELFRGSNIVNDFLETIGVELRCEQQSTINSSYSFEALELKRYANHFPLGPLEHPLDQVLQRCPIGERAYSLTPPKRYEAARAQMLSELDAFIERHGLEHLKTLRQHLAEKPQRPYRAQKADDAGLEAVTKYLRDEAPELYAELGVLVRNFAHVALPNPHFFACFGVTGGQSVAPEGTVHAVELAKALASKPHQAPDMAREIALFFERRGDIESARLFMEAAYRLRPHGDMIRRKLNEYREKAGQKREP